MSEFENERMSECEKIFYHWLILSFAHLLSQNP